METATLERQDNENVQPALVNSAIASVGDPLPEGNRKEMMDQVRAQADSLRTSTVSPTHTHNARHFVQEFERRSRAMPFVRFVALGEPLPVEIGNVDKLQLLDGTGTWYMFPTSENLRLSYGGDPEDPTQGQEAQGGPLHFNTGRGEKYAGGNVETELVAEHLQAPQAHGKGSQTGGTGIQRWRPDDASAIGGAVEDTDAGNRPDQYPGQDGEAPVPASAGIVPGVVRHIDNRDVQQVSKPAAYAHEPGIIRRSRDASKLTAKPESFALVKEEVPAVSPPETELATIGPRQGGRPGRATRIRIGGRGKRAAAAAPNPGIVDTAAADVMKEGEKTSTDAAAAGAVTASASASDIEASSPGTMGSDGGKQAPDASEGTAKDTETPTVFTDWAAKNKPEIQKYLTDEKVSFPSTATKPELVELASQHERTAGEALAKQKSDEATPQTAGGVIAGEQVKAPADTEQTDETDTDDKTK